MKEAMIQLPDNITISNINSIPLEERIKLIQSESLPDCDYESNYGATPNDSKLRTDKPLEEQLKNLSEAEDSLDRLKDNKFKLTAALSLSVAAIAGVGNFLLSNSFMDCVYLAGGMGLFAVFSLVNDIEAIKSGKDHILSAFTEEEKKEVELTRDNKAVDIHSKIQSLREKYNPASENNTKLKM